MKALYGLGNHSVYSVRKTLRGHSKDLRVQVIHSECRVDQTADVLLVSNVSNFLRVRKELNASNAVVFVFDTPVLLEYLKPIVLLDVKKRASFRYSYVDLRAETLIRALSEKTTKITVESFTIDLIPKLLEGTFPSIMKPVLTFLYTIPDLEKRLLFRFQILTYMMNRRVGADDLKQTLIELSRQKKSYRALDDLIDFLTTDSVKATRKVLRKVSKAKKQGKSVKIDKLCEEYKVNSFDVRYVSKAFQADQKHFVAYPENKRASKGKD